MWWRNGIPAPVQQYSVYDGTELVGTTDYAWPQYRLFGEFDGMRKYFRDGRPGEAPEDVIVREKRREDRIRRLTGWSFFRFTWADLNHPARTCAALRRQMEIAA